MNTKSLFIIASCALALVGCKGKTENQGQASGPQKTPAVTVETATAREVAIDQTYSVTLQAFAVNNIAPQAGARIASIKAEIGDFVSKGQLLAEMDRTNLDQAELQMNNKKAELERMRSLREKGGISQSDFEAIELGYKVSESTYENLKTNTVLRSPLNGVVTARNYDQGDMYTMSAPLYVVQQIDPMKILVSVSEKDYPLLKKGVKVEVKADAVPGKTFGGEVVRVYPTIDPATHTVSAEVNIPNKSAQLRPGMYANCRVIYANAKRVVLSDSAVMKQQGSGQRTVYVLNDDNSVTLRVVEVGRHMGSTYEILSGVEEGEKVVISGQTALRSGVKVDVLNK